MARRMGEGLSGCLAEEGGRALAVTEQHLLHDPGDGQVLGTWGHVRGRGGEAGGPRRRGGRVGPGRANPERRGAGRGADSIRRRERGPAGHLPAPPAAACRTPPRMQHQAVGQHAVG